jgi:hypothetical protein
MPTSSTPSPLSSSSSSHHNNKVKSEKHSHGAKARRKSLENNSTKSDGNRNVDRPRKSNNHSNNPIPQAIAPQHFSQPHKSPSQHHLLMQNQMSQFQSFLTNNININNSMYQQHPSELPMPPNQLPPQPPTAPPCQGQALPPLMNFQHFQNPKQCLNWQEYMMAATSMANALKTQQHQSHQQHLFNLNQIAASNSGPMPPINQSVYQSAFTTLLKQISEMSHTKTIKEETLVDKTISGGQEQDVSSISTSSSTCSSNYDMNNNKQNVSLQNGDDYEEDVEIEEGEIDPNDENYDDYDVLSEKEAKKSMHKAMLANANSLYSSQSAALYSSSTPPSSVSSNSSLSNNKIKLEANNEFLMAQESMDNRNSTGREMSPSSIAKRNLKHSIDFILGANASLEAKQHARQSIESSISMKRQRLMKNNMSHFGNGVKKAKNMT